ncbi:thioredoxin family protein [archaeon]|nr:thioredoxin family protein [archaeon]PJC45509.1 MAG: hypothetical protein CO037_01135 [Candidatus Pacearchaeota archaeon CG_4_9_14_0_2_um_filter_30_8]
MERQKIENKKMNRKWVFFQAFLLTVVVLVIGLYAGISFEEGRFEKVNGYYLQSEVSLVDILALNNLVGMSDLSCLELENANVDLLNRVYEEASLLDQYEESGKLTQNLVTFHKKYDILRTYLWINSIKIKEICPDKLHTLVYLYNHDEEDLTKRAEQNVWSKLLLEIKNENPHAVLISIARDSNLVSLNSLIEQYNITSFPAVVVDEKSVFEKITPKEEIVNLIN